MHTPNILSPIEFGKQLIQTGDLDPVYIVLWEAELPHDLLCNWLLAYWCFYHCGTASWIASGTEMDPVSVAFNNPKSYWLRFFEAAGSKDYPRSSERRHFRGENALKCVRYLLESRLTPSDIVGRLSSHGKPQTLPSVIAEAKKIYGFGDWIAFKIADMLSCLGLAKTEFKYEDSLTFYDSPREGGVISFNCYHSLTAQRNTDDATKLHWAVTYLQQELAHNLKLKAPPQRNRLIHYQEIETILCKFKSHSKGKYQVGHDIAEVKESLLRYSKCRLSQKLIAAGSKGGLW